MSLRAARFALFTGAFCIAVGVWLLCLDNLTGIVLIGSGASCAMNYFHR